MSQPFRSSSYRNPNGVRGEAPRTPGRGRGTGTGWGTGPSSRTREAAPTAPAGVELTPSAESAWAIALERLRPVVSAASFEHWLEPVRLLGEHEGRIVVATDQRGAFWFRNRFASALSEAMGRELLVCEDGR